MKEIILIKNGEIVLKGLNRSRFEDRMLKNIRRRLSDLGEIKFLKSQSTVTIYPKDENYDYDEACGRIAKIFGIAAFSRAAVCSKDIEEIKNTAYDYFKKDISAYNTFKIEAKRSDKSFPLKSPEICNEVGGFLLSKFRHLKVDVHNPELTVRIEVRDKEAYVHGNQIKGAGGLPVGSSGRGVVLMSGGIDSPVAAYMMAKRGLELSGIHFAAPPYTSQRAEEKVIELTRKVSAYAGRICLFIVPFTEIQETIRDACPEELFTVIMRRLMMEIANRICEQQKGSAIITGESLAQVASQTVYALACTDESAKFPVLRPLIGMDKNEIVDIARKIDTFETSILPYEDCCTVFTPKHPKTKPSLDEVLAGQNLVDWEEMLQKAVNNTKFKVIKG